MFTAPYLEKTEQVGRMVFFLFLFLLLHPFAHATDLQGSFAGYFTLNEVEQYMINVKRRLKDLATSPVPIGQSNGNRDILSMCLGQCGDSATPAMLYTGLHHAREPMGMMAVIYTMEHIVSQYLSGDPSMAALLEARSVWFIPAVNPDGYESNRAHKPNGGGNQRKNSNGVDSNKCANARYDSLGVDLNRNYATCWSGDCPTGHDVVKHSDCGSSKRPCDEDYRGKGVFSEPESRAIRDFVQEHSSSITTALNFHSFAQQVYMPYSCTKILSSESEADKTTMNRMAKEWGTTADYIVDHVWNTGGGGLGYSAAGDATDWMLYAHGIFALTPETGPKDAEIFKALGSTSMGDPFYEYGFWPPKTTIPRYANATTAANVRMVWVSGPCYDVQVLSVKPSVDGSPTKTIDVELINVGVNDTTATPLVVSVVARQAVTSAGSTAGETPQEEYTLLGASAKLAPPERNHVGRISLRVPEHAFDDPLALPFIVVGDDVTCAINTIGKYNLASKTWPITNKKHVRHCELCSTLNPGVGRSPGPSSSGGGNDGGSGSGASGASGASGGDGNGNGSGGEATATPSVSNVPASSSSSSSGANSGTTTPSDAKAAPCAPVSGGDDSTVPSSSMDVKIDWTVLWVSIALLILGGCCCGCVMMLCMKQYQQQVRYNKLTIGEEDRDDLQGIEIGRYKDDENELSDVDEI
jgi:hypothetical protein